MVSPGFAVIIAKARVNLRLAAAERKPHFPVVSRPGVHSRGSQIIGLDKAIEKKLNQLGGGKIAKETEPVYAGAN